MDLRQELLTIHDTLSRRGFDTRTLVFEPAAKEHDLLSVERRLGVTLPSSLRGVLAFVSSHVEFRWFAPQDTRFDKPFHQSFSGDLHWSLELLLQYARDKQGWIETVFKDPADPYNRVWHNKLAFHEVGNGDYIALDLTPEFLGQVVYLSHDDGRGHGHVMAPSFAALLENWVPLACPGGEDWQWIPFTHDLTAPIDSNSENGRRWRAVLQLDT